MNLEDRARDAARDLQHKSATVPPPGIRERQRSIPPVAFAAGFAAVVLLVLVPLVFFGGPREGEEPAISTSTTTLSSPTTTTPLPSTTTTSVPSTTRPADPAVGAVVIPSLAELVAPAEDYSVVARFEWGEQVGTNEKGVGPCCFDVASDGTVVMVDSANLRLVAMGPRLAGFRVLAEWEAGDFVPHAILVKPQPQNDIIHVLGMTNEPNRPNDLITMTLDGTVIDRGRVDVEFNPDLVVSAGSVWAVDSPAGADVGWRVIAGEVGDVRAGPQQDALLLGDRGSLDVTVRPQATGVTVAVRDADGNGTDYEIDFDQETWGHQVVPWIDGFVVIASTTDIDIDGTVGRVAAQFDRAGNLVEGFSWQGSFYAEIGPRGIATVRNGAIYEMHSTAESVEIRRYPLAQARDADELAVRLADARAIDRAGQWTWVATAPDAAGDSEVLKLDNNAELLAAYHVPGEITALDAEGSQVWLVVLDQDIHLVARLAIGTGELTLGRADDHPPIDILAHDGGVWALFHDEQTGTRGLLPVVDPELSGDREAIFLPDDHSPIGMVQVGETLWIATAEGLLLRYDAAEEMFLEGIDVGIELIDISVVSDGNDRFGHAIWVAGADGSLHRYDSDDGTKTTDAQLGGLPLLVQNPDIDVQYVVLDSGDVYVAGEDWGPMPVVESGARAVNAAMFDGRLWLLGESLVVLSFAG